jgi:hypothetical protein
VAGPKDIGTCTRPSSSQQRKRWKSASLAASEQAMSCERGQKAPAGAATALAAIASATTAKLLCIPAAFRSTVRTRPCPSQ